MEINWKELAEKYQMEAEIYALAYEDVLKPIRMIAAMQGVLVQMESERLKFEKKRGKSDKSKETGDRIDILMSGLDELSGIAEKNISLRQQLKYKSIWLVKAEQELEKLRKQLSWDDSATP